MAEAAPQSATTLEQLKKMLDDFRVATERSRKASCLYRDYYDGEQLTSDERRILRGRKQPEIIINRVRRGIDGILGVVEQGKTDPRAYMRNPPDQIGGGSQPAQTAAGTLPIQQQPQQQQPEEDAADIASKALRFIADTNHFGPLKMDVLENGLIEGTGAAIIEASGDNITLTQVRWEELVYDPRSRRADFADARYMGIAKWMYADQASALTNDPAKKKEIESACESSMLDWISRDRPTNQLAWVDRKQKRLLVVELYYQEVGQWWRCVFVTNTIIEQAPSAYLNDKGQTICPIEAQSAYVDRENGRYGPVKDMVGPQDGLNMSHSKALHASNVRQVQPIDGNAAPVDNELVRQEAARPDGILPPGWKFADNNFAMQGAVERIQEYKAEMERMGPNPAILGRQGADASGRAVLARQQAGLTELARPLGRFNDWELRVYKQMWARARQFWTAPKWIRVTDDEGAAQYIQVNELVGVQQTIDQQTGQPVSVPQFKNHIAEMDVDIIVDSVPNTANLQQEVFSEIMELARVNPQAFPPKVLLQFAPIPDRRKVIEAIEQAQQEMAAGQADAIRMQAQKDITDIEKTKSEIALNNSTAGLNEVKTVTAAMEGHVTATAAAELPQGYTLGPNGQHIPLQAPPPGMTGDTGASAVT